MKVEDSFKNHEGKYDISYIIKRPLTSSMLWLVLAEVFKKGMPWLRASCSPLSLSTALSPSQSHLLPISSRSTSGEASWRGREEGRRNHPTTANHVPLSEDNISESHWVPKVMTAAYMHQLKYLVINAHYQNCHKIGITIAT